MTKEQTRKVCILTTVHPTFDTRIFHKEAKTLVQAGYDVTLIVQHDGDTEVEGVRIIALPKPRNRLQRIFGLTWRAFRLALREKADIYHFHDPELLPIGVLLKLFTRGKVIYDVHENVKEQILNKAWLPLWSRKLLSLSYELIEKLSILVIDEVIIAEDSYTKNYQGHKNVTAIRNYPILSYLETHTGTRIAADLVMDGDHNFKVTYVGGVTKLRGALELIESISIVKANGHQGVVLNLIGPIMPPALRAELDGLIREYGLKQDVSIPGRIPHDTIYEVLSKSNVGVAILRPDPNYVESLPTKLFEYMAAGLPVIASNFPLWKEIVEGNECGLTVDPLDPKEIAQAIEYLITHPEEARRMGENGRRAVEEKYNWETEGRKLLQLYEGLTSS